MTLINKFLKQWKDVLWLHTVEWSKKIDAEAFIGYFTKLGGFKAQCTCVGD